MSDITQRVYNKISKKVKSKRLKKKYREYCALNGRFNGKMKK